MNTDFRIEVGFFDHHKTRRLIAALGLEAAWCLLRLWEFTAVNKPDGSLSGMTEEDIAAACHYPGDARQFVAELLRLRWLVKGRRSTLVKDWKEHQPFAINAPRRRAAAKKAAETRWKSSKTKDAPRMRNASKSHATRNAPAFRPAFLPEEDIRAAASPGAGDGLRPFLDHAIQTWKADRGVDPPWAKAEFQLLTRCFKSNLKSDLDVATAAWDRFMADRSPFVDGHNPKKFASDPGRWIGKEKHLRKIDGEKKSVCANCGLDDTPVLKSGYCKGCEEAIARRASV